MNTVIAPELLQLVALGTDGTGDDYLDAGRCLRWFPNSTLGFPRRGFVLYRRPSPGWYWQRDASVGPIADGVRVAGTDAEPVDDGAIWLRGVKGGATPERGVRVSSPGDDLSPTADEVELTAEGVVLEFLDGDRTRPDPAAWVALRISGEEKTRVTATATAASADSSTVDFSAVDAKLGDLDPWIAHGEESGDRIVVLHGSVVDAVEIHADGDAAFQEVIWLPADRYATDFDGAVSPVDDGWEEVERFSLPIDVTGDHYTSHPPGEDSEELARRRLERGATRTGPPWDEGEDSSPAGPDEVAADLVARYLHGVDPDDGADGNFERLEAIQALFVDLLDEELDREKPQGTITFDDLYGGGGGEGPESKDVTDLSALEFALTASLDAPLAHLLGLATVDDEPAPGRPYDYMVTAIYPSAWLVHATGLGSALSAGVPTTVLEALVGRSDLLGDALAAYRESPIPIVPPDSTGRGSPGGPRSPKGGRKPFGRGSKRKRRFPFGPKRPAERDPPTGRDPPIGRGPLTGRDPPTGPRTPVGPPVPSGREGHFFHVCSLATAVREGSASAVRPPADLSVETIPVQGGPEIAVEARLRWETPGRSRFDPSPVVGTTATRTDDEGEQSLARLDPEYGLPVPHLVGGGESSHRDSPLRTYGETTWQVRSVDVWGRWSEPTAVTETVANEAPPQPPHGVTVTPLPEIRVGDETAEEGTVDEVVVAFGWSDGFVPAGVELDHVEVALEPGYHDVEPSDTLADPGMTITIPADGDGLDVESVGGDSDAVGSIELESDGGDTHVEVAFEDAPISTNDDVEHRWELTATVRAVDEAGLASRAGVDHGTLYEEAAPSEPGSQSGGISETTWPDSDGLCWWTCTWDADDGERIQVLTASESRLLDLAGKDRADLAGLDDVERANELRAIAAGEGEYGDVEATHAFSPDHPGRYGPDEEHAVAIDAGTHEFTLVYPVKVGPTGVRAEWPTDPTAFAVVATRRLERIPEPHVRVRASGDYTGPVAEFDVDASSAASRAVIWRTTDPDDVADVREMQLRRPAALDGGVLAEDYVDEVEPGEWYAYRVAVETGGGRRSEVTDPIWVRSR